MCCCFPSSPSSPAATRTVASSPSSTSTVAASIGPSDCAGAAPPPIPPSATSSEGSTQPQSRPSSAATPPSCRPPGRYRDRAALLWMARHCVAVSTTSTTAPPPRSSAPSPQTPPWCSPISTSTTNPTKSPRRRHCSLHWDWPLISSPSMPCTAKKNLRDRGRGQLRPDRPEPAPAKAGVKDNQPPLLLQLDAITPSAAPLDRVESTDNARTRHESRTVSVFDPLDAFANSDWKPHVAAVVRVERDVLTRTAKTGLWERSNHTAYYISNTKITAERAAQAIRAHWTIENTSHYTRDVTMGEDQSRIRSKPGVFARLRSFAYNILKANKSNTLSQDRYRAALGGLWPLLKLLVIQQR